MNRETQRYVELNAADQTGPISSDYSSDFSASLRRAARTSLLDYFGYQITPVTKWCDVGCNNGYNLKSIQAKGAQIKGVDLCAEARANGIDACVGSMTRLPYADNEFDVTVMMEALYHLRPDEQLEAMNENWRVTKPDGIIIYVTTNFDSILRRCFRSDMHRYTYDVKEINRFFTGLGAEGAAAFPRFPFGWGLSMGLADRLLTAFRLALYPVIGLAWRLAKRS